MDAAARSVEIRDGAAYIKTNGYEACVVNDPVTSKPFPNGIDLLNYANTVAKELEKLPYRQPDEIIEPGMSVTRVWHPYNFLCRFTDHERIAVMAASMSDPVVKNMEMMLNLSKSIESTNEHLLKAMDYLVAVKIITQDRKTEILTGE